VRHEFADSARRSPSRSPPLRIGPNIPRRGLGDTASPSGAAAAQACPVGSLDRLALVFDMGLFSRPNTPLLQKRVPSLLSEIQVSENESVARTRSVSEAQPIRRSGAVEADSASASPSGSPMPGPSAPLAASHSRHSSDGEMIFSISL
jgi:hypothetical protein